jgi:hypothetical protein
MTQYVEEQMPNYVERIAFPDNVRNDPGNRNL